MEFLGLADMVWISATKFCLVGRWLCGLLYDVQPASQPASRLQWTAPQLQGQEDDDGHTQIYFLLFLHLRGDEE